jgi:RNA polymerase sigma-70 factor (ECF subfamily)
LDELSANEFADLVSRAARGDPGALDTLVRQYEPKVRLVARVLLGPALRPYLDSVDLTQSVHKSIFVGLRDEKFQIAGPEQLVALALTVLRRKAARHWRHLQRQQRLSGAGGEGVAPGLADPVGTGLDPADEAQFRDQAERLCTHLDEVERRILDLRLEGHSSPEIAALTGLSPVNVRVRMTRLRQRLHAAGVLADWL